MSSNTRRWDMRDNLSKQDKLVCESLQMIPQVKVILSDCVLSYYNSCEVYTEIGEVLELK